MKSHHIHLLFHSFILFFVHLSSAFLLLQCRVKCYHHLIIICRLKHEESLSLIDIVHHDVKYHSQFSLIIDLNSLLNQSNQLRLFIKLSSYHYRFFISHRPQFNQTSKPKKIVHQTVKYHSQFSLITDLNSLLNQLNQLRLFIKLSSIILYHQ